MLVVTTVIPILFAGMNTYFDWYLSRKPCCVENLPKKIFLLNGGVHLLIEVQGSIIEHGDHDVSIVKVLVARELMSFPNDVENDEENW